MPIQCVCFLPISRRRPLRQPSPPGQPGSSFKACLECPEVIWLPQGSYMLGSSAATDPEHWDEEKPQRKVTITYTFAAGKYPVTYQEWDACYTDGACPYALDLSKLGRGKYPVTFVSYSKIIKSYLPWLIKQAKAAGRLPAGYQFALPTESEREYFARGITQASDPHPPFPSLPGTRWADGRCPHTDAFNCTPQRDYANCGANTGLNRQNPLPVHELPYRNRFGLFSVAGNVNEWMLDC